MKLCIALVCLLCLPPAIIAQSNAGMIRGVVTDKNNSVVAGARVQLTNAVTRYSQTTTTDSQGAYRLIDVPFNNYRLTVEGTGFEPLSRALGVHSNLAQQVDVQLGVAGVSQVVDVNAERGLIEPEKTAPTTVIDRNLIQRFPTSQPSRSAEEIVATAPGWTEDANGRLHARGARIILRKRGGLEQRARCSAPRR